MKTFTARPLGLVTALLLVSLSPVALAAPIAVHGRLGLGTLAMGDVNDQIAALERAFQGAGLSPEFDDFGVFYDFGGGVGLRVRPDLELGIDASYMSRQRSNGFSSSDFSIKDRMTASLLQLTGRVEYFVPSEPALSFGVEAGYGRGEFSEDFSILDYTNASNNDEYEYEGDGSGFVGGGFGAYRFNAGPNSSVITRIGYRARNLGAFFGSDSNGAEGAIYGADGKVMDFDYSGLYATIGVEFLLGGAAIPSEG